VTRGKNIRLVQSIILFLIVLPAAGLALFTAVRSQKASSPNILVITVDALRFDHLSCYGYHQRTSPTIDELADTGVRFTNAISQASWTCPSLNAFITSTYPSTNGVYFWGQEPGASIPTLPEILGKDGYYTGFISSHGGLGSLGKKFKDPQVNHGLEGTEMNTSRAIRWLEKHKGEKFFLWIHYMENHYKSLGIPDGKHPAEEITKEEIERYRSKYDKALSHTDAQIALIVHTLKALGLYGKTVIIISADHGMQMGEHGLWFCHGAFLWDNLLRVPLIISGPSLSARGKVIANQVQLIDVFPTVCDIAGIRKPATAEGRSLLPLIKGGTLGHEYAFSEYKDFDKPDDWVYRDFPWVKDAEEISIRSPEWKFISIRTKNGDRKYQLYNLRADPLEQADVVDTEKERSAFMREKLQVWMKRATKRPPPLNRTLDDKTRENLHSLGYLK
jgi:choline-sulfatase